MSRESKKPLGDKPLDELSEDMEVVGPGQMLSEARNQLSLSVEEVANKLKFKATIVENIEQDVFDQKLPATFNRGYLRSYAKLVQVDIDEVLSAYDMLGVAEAQRSEMQSFSNLTEKQAEHSRIMWLSYFIVAILCGLMVLWWQQEPKQTVDESTSKEQSISVPEVAIVTVKKNTELVESDNVPTSTQLDANELVSEKSLPMNSPENETVVESSTAETPTEPLEEAAIVNIKEESEIAVAEISTAVFTFSGDCWVNIFDATGERIAWGVKKSGYVMTITGQAPLKITLGKPELAAIIFNDQLVDTSEFSAGNIAKFTLPLNL